jgi:phosphoribosylanthranilate isomerase
MRVKVCGITNLEDALICYEHGANALGFIFASGSPRFISSETCAKITRALPPFCERIGVFVDTNPQQVVQIANQCQLSAIQLHGQMENADYIQELARLINIPIIRAIRVQSSDVSELTYTIGLLPENLLQALLIDGPGKGQVPFEIFNSLKKEIKLPLILAGSLNSENIKTTIHELNPKYIDLCSSLESQPGKKDPDKIKRFFQEVKNA